MSLSEETQPASASRGARTPRLVSVLGLVFAVVLLAVIGGAAWAGYQAGQTDRDNQARATLAVDLQHQFELGLADLSAGRYDLAVVRFEYVLGLDPDYPGVREKLAEALAGLNVTATPPPPTAPPVTGETPADILAAAQAYADAGNWDGVIAQITRLHGVDAGYERLQADGLLFTALRGRGLARIQGDEMEAGIFDLDQAAAFRPLDAEATSFRAWARLYLAARSYWGVDWVTTVDILRQLYVLAPNFKDTTQLLYQATLQAADQFNLAGDVCMAANYYAASQEVFVDDAIAEKMTLALTNCALTPTPEPTVPGVEGDVTSTPTP
jgi:tetratricopeptide (TPR) repeat protein